MICPIVGGAASVASNNTDKKKDVPARSGPPIDVCGFAAGTRVAVDRKGRVMKSMRGLRVVVVIDSEHGHMLAARLRRMEVGTGHGGEGLEEARLLCQSGKR